MALATRITQDEFAVSATLIGRVVPALFFGPVAGVLVDRWNRKRVMVGCDLARAAVILILPFLGSISAATRLSPIVMLILISALLEMLTLMWQPAKDASLPQMLRPTQLTHANSLISLAAYGTFPLAGVAFSLLVPASKWLGRHVGILAEFTSNPEHLALYFDAVTYSVSAIITATIAIPASKRVRQRLSAGGAFREFAEGIRFIAHHPRVKPWLFAIGMIYAGVGTFIAIAIFYVSEVLGAGGGGQGLIIAATGTGLVLGFALAAVAARIIPRDVLFAGSVFGLAVCLFAFASVSTLTAGLGVAVLLGIFAGFAYPAALTLMQESVDDEIRGRVMASGQSVIRLALVGALAFTPAVAKLIGDRQVVFLAQQLDLRGSRIVMWVGGILIFLAGIFTTRAVSARWRGIGIPTSGTFVVFEGGDGAGKTTQIRLLAERLEAEGVPVVTTLEPGGTKIGERIRDLLLDPSAQEMHPKAEALLYAADRAQHVAEVIRPALDRGAVVISDRFLDSSLAYQGLARGLGVDSVLDLNQWGTGGLLPDLVLFLDADPQEGLSRSGASDRLETEDPSFHQRVREAYLALSRRYAERFAVIPSGTPAEVAAMIDDRVDPLIKKRRALLTAESAEASG